MRQPLVQASHYPQCQLCLENEAIMVTPPSRTTTGIIHEMAGQEQDFSIRPMLILMSTVFSLEGQHCPMAINVRV